MGSSLGRSCTSMTASTDVRLMNSDIREPLNVGSEELVTINQLVDLVADIAGITVTRRHILDAPQGVRGRNSDNALIRKLLGWEPSTSLRSGLRRRTSGSTARWQQPAEYANTRRGLRRTPLPIRTRERIE